MIRLLPLVLAFCCTLGLSAQSSSFHFTENTEPTIGFEDIRIATVDLEQFRTDLKRAPMEFTGAKSKTTVSLPLPNGSFAEFVAYNSPMVKSNPDLNSFKISGPWGGGRVATSPRGMSAVMRGPNGYVVIEPVEAGSDAYRVAEYNDYMALFADAQAPLACGYDDLHMPEYGSIELDEDMLSMGAIAGAAQGNKAGNDARELRVYDLIITNTGEFAQRSEVGGTVAGVMEAFNTATSTLNAIFENEIGIRMNLVEVPGLIYTDGSTDPFVNPRSGGGLLGQVIGAFNNNNVSLAAYDLGHILTARCDDVGGVVSGAACNDGGKTRGVTCVGGSIVFTAMGTMAHEIAHQFAVSHSWNNCPGSDGQRAAVASFEPGSGTTIMSYAGACGNQNIGGRDAYYSVGSLQQFLTFTRETGAAECATVVETDNFTPEVSFDYTDDFYIPVSTPFRLEGTATDANSDNLTYNWEQFDLGPPSDIRDPQGNAPLFRSLRPDTEGNVRYFPRLNNLVDNTITLGEKLPDYSRDMTFRLVARDNNSEAGGVDWKQLHFYTSDEAGPFVVNNPEGDTWKVGQYREVTWDVANTDKTPINTKCVNIVLSTDGGDTFDLVLAKNTPNTGSGFVTIPEAALSSNARIMVEAADNIFLNVNRNGFAIEAAADTSFTLETLCLPDGISIDLNTGSVLGFDAPISLSIESGDLPAEAIVDFTASTIDPGMSSTLNIDLSDVRYNGPLEITVVAAAEGQDTARRTVLYEVTDNDYSDLATMAPEEGTTGIILATTFDWTEAVNANTYEIEIATSPTFSDATLFERAEGLTVTEYLPAEFFEANTLYYWRIRPVNICGPGAWTDPNSFRTINSQCEIIESGDTPIGMPGNGPAFTRTSSIFVEQGGAISDVNIPNINVRYNFASKITLTLISPAGTRVVLYRERCLSTNRVDLGFDDEAPIDVACPPDDERVFLPRGTLADFNGEDSFGNWVMEVGVSQTGGSAGSIESWNIEFCSDVSAIAPTRINNVATDVPPLGRDVITRDNLSVTSAGFDSGSVIYTITSLPEAGRLLIHGDIVAVGDTFRQADIDGLGLFYENTDDNFTTDDFGFVVTTPDGGYLPGAYHDIIIEEGAAVSNRNVSVLDAGLEVFPNPTSGDLSIRWALAVNRQLAVELFDLNGRLLQSREVAGATKAAAINLVELPAGIYLLRIDGAVRRIVKR